MDKNNENYIDMNKFEFSAFKLNKSYGGAKIVDDFSISVNNGEVVGLVGDNGAGKSTVMRMAALVEAADTGQISINGIKAEENIKEFRSKIGYIPQSNALIDEMTALDNMKLFSLLNKDETAAKINELAEAFDMEEFLHKKVKHLSGGMVRRVNIAVGLINNPSMIVADEPFAGLDKTQREKVINYLKELSRNGVGQLISSHYVENLKTWSKSIIAL